MQDFHEGAFNHANNRRGGEFPYIGKATNTQWDGVPDLAFHPASGNIAHMYWAAPVKCTELKLKNLQGYRVPECGSWVKVKVKNMASNKDVAELQFNGGQWSGKADTVYDVGAMDVGDKVDFGFDNVNDYACDNARLRFVLECNPLPLTAAPTVPPTSAPTTLAPTNPNGWIAGECNPEDIEITGIETLLYSDSLSTSDETMGSRMLNESTWQVLSMNGCETSLICFAFADTSAGASHQCHCRGLVI